MRPVRKYVSNQQVAAALREMAEHLQHLGEIPFRFVAYRRGATAVARCEHDLSMLLEEAGEAGLRKIPGVGKSLARSITRLLRGGRLTKLERLRKADQGVSLLRSLPGVGPRIAERLGQALAGDSLEEVFAAACDGRLRRVPGLGAKRLRAIRESLATRLQASEPATTVGAADEPAVEDLLAIDEEYRRKAAEGRLPRATPRSFNPTGSAWLPVLRTTRNGRNYSAHFANTARSHQLGSFRDWVVITCETKQAFGQWTVITARHGELRGKRLIMHHESACREHYRHRQKQLALPLN